MYNNISNDAKTALKSRVVTTTARITLTSNNQVIDGNNLVNVTITDQCYQDGVIVGTAMCKEVEIELIDNNYDLADKEFSLEVGVLLPNSSYEYIPYGNFIVKDYQKIISSNHYKLIAYDYMDKFNSTFVDNNPTLEDGVTYTTPMTLQSFYQYVANQFGVTIETQSNLPNANFSITTKPYLEGLSGRNVLSRIAEMMGCFAKINRNNKLEMKLKTTTSEKFSRNEMNNSLERDNRFGPINVISLRLSQVEGENVTKRDEASISQYGETTLQIQDNPFCYTEALRLAAINAIYNKVDGFSYYPTTFNGKLIYLDVGDEVEVQDMETDTYYKTIILKQVLKIPSTRNSKFENKALTNVGLEHQFTPEQVRKDRRTEYLVDKQNGVIQQIVETTEEIEHQFETLQDIDGFAEGKYIYLDDASDELITSAKFNGETSQEGTPSPDYPSEIENLEGKNLFNENQLLEATGWTKNSEGYYTGTSGNLYAKFKLDAGGFHFAKSFKENTRYILSWTAYTSSGTGNPRFRIYYTNNTYQDCTNWNYTTPTTMYTVSAANKTISKIIYTYGDNPGTIYIKDIQLEEGSTATPYAPYNSLKVKAVNKNLLDKNKTALGSNVTKTVLDTGVRITTKVAGNARYCGIEIGKDELLGKKVTISANITVSGTNDPGVRLYFGDATAPAKTSLGSVLTTNGSKTITIPSSFPTGTDRIYLLMYSSLNSSEVGAYVEYTNLQVEIAEEATTYEGYKEQTVYFPLAEGQKLYEGSYLADDGIHNVRGQRVFDGSSDEDWKIWALSGNNVERFYINITNSAMNKEFKSSHFIMSSLSDNGDYEHSRGAASSGQYIQWICFISKSKATTVAELKTWLSSNPVTLEYKLAEEEIIPYNTEQQAAWNNIKSLHTYKTVTHIYSDAYAEIGYIKDNMLSAFETKASAQLTKNDVSQLKIENGRISSEVSSTQSQFNNYYTKNEADNNTNSTKAELQNIIQQNKTEVEQTTQALNLRVSSIETNGVDKIETSMGYTFNNEGLNIDKDGAATASTIDNEAFKVKNKSANENVFFAGYVSDQNSAYRGQTIVESTNLVVKNYLNIEGASRFQPYVNPVLGGHGTGAFDIG